VETMRVVAGLLLLLSLTGCDDDAAEGPAGGAVAAGDRPQAAGEATSTTPAGETEPKEDAEEAATGPFRIGEAGDLRTAALRYRRLLREGRAGDTWITPAGDGRYALMAPETAKAEDAREIARAIEVEASPQQPDREDALEPSMVRTTVPLNLRAGPDADEELIRTLPDGTVAVVLHGQVDGKTSEPGGRGNWSYTVATANDQGWSASRYHEPYDGCLPIPAKLLDDVPRRRVAELRRDITYTTVDLRIDGRTRDGFMLVARDPDQRMSHVAVLRDAGECNVEEVRQYAVQGIVEDAFVLTTEPRGGETLVVTVSHPEPERDPEGEQTHRVYVLDRDTPVWDRTLPTGPNATYDRWTAARAVTEGASGVEGYWPLAFIPEDMQAGPGEYFAWTGSTLEHDDTALDGPPLD